MVPAMVQRVFRARQPTKIENRIEKKFYILKTPTPRPKGKNHPHPLSFRMKKKGLVRLDLTICLTRYYKNHLSKYGGH